MRNDGPDEAQTEVRDQVVAVSSGSGQPFERDGKNDQQDNGHTESRQTAHKNADRHEKLVKSTLTVSGQCAEPVSNDPSHHDGRELQSNGPTEGRAKDIGHRPGILAERETKVSA